MSLTSAAAGVLCLMVVVIIGGFTYIQHQYHELSEIREHARQLRIARQAIMDVDAYVLNALAVPKHKQDPFDYVRALDLLTRHEAQVPAAIAWQEKAIASGEFLAALKQDWHDVSRLSENGELENAKQVYFERQTFDRVKATVNAIEQTLTTIESDFLEQNNAVNNATAILLLVQILTGAGCVLAFYQNARTSKRQAEIRAKAVVEAEASRVQVGKLFEMADMLQSASDYDDANAVLRSSATDLIFGFSGALYVFSNSRDRLVLSTHWEREGFDELPESLSIQQCWALKRGKQHINRPYSRKLCCEHHTTNEYALEIPMLARGEILGLLQIYAEGDEAEERLKAIAGLGAALADAMSLALANIALREKLRGQALRDPLTGLYNRRYMEDAIDRFVRLAERENRDLSVIMIDLDHFKRLNDQYGHAQGDSVLRDSAAAIGRHLRETDVACRYGGEELIILLPDCNIDMAAHKAEDIRLSIEALTNPNGPKVSASLGVAAMPANSAKDLVSSADSALYQAKQEGRNRVVRAPETAPHAAKNRQHPNSTRNRTFFKPPNNKKGGHWDHPSPEMEKAARAASPLDIRLYLRRLPCPEPASSYPPRAHRPISVRYRYNGHALRPWPSAHPTLRTLVRMLEEPMALSAALRTRRSSPRTVTLQSS